MSDAADDPEETRVIFSALDSFLRYAKAAHFSVTHMRRQSFYALPQTHWKMLAAPPFSFLETLNRTDEAIESNAELARAIAHFGLQTFGSVGASSAAEGREPALPDEWVGSAKHPDIDKARSTVRQFFRDWSAEGASERDACYGIVFRFVEEEKKRRAAAARGREGNGNGNGNGNNGGRGDDTCTPLHVLVPGAGLGRLVFELCLRGCNTEGNEISYHQLLASSYVLNHTQRVHQHTIFPWIHTFSNHRTRANHLRSYTIPDIHPAKSLAEAEANGPVGKLSMCAADFLCLYQDEAHASAYDVVATVFFLDTAPNLIRYLEVMRHCLRPGGVLVNIGPLLWHFENNAPGMHGSHDDDAQNSAAGIADPGSFELADDEVMALLEKVGFVVEWKQTAISAPYIHDSESMLQTTYLASAWVARKPLDSANKGR